MVITGDGLSTTPKVTWADEVKEATEGPLGLEIALTEDQVRGVKEAGYVHPEVHVVPPPYTPQVFSKEYWSYTDPSLSQGSKREAAIEKAVQLYHKMHHILGHRSKEHTIRTLEWMVKRLFPPEAEVRIPECEACIQAKRNLISKSRSSLQ